MGRRWLSLRKRMRPAWLLVAGFALLVGISALFDGPRSLYAHAIVVCLDCIGLI